MKVNQNETSPGHSEDESGSDSSSVYSDLDDEDDSDESFQTDLDDSSGEDVDKSSQVQESADIQISAITANGAGRSPLPQSVDVASVDEYQFDSSDEEDLRNTVGNIPLRWYDDYPHLGYDWDGSKILKPARDDLLNEFLRKMEDPNYWRTVQDKSTGQDVLLTDEDLELIMRIQKGSYPDGSYNPFEPFEDIFSHEKMIHPVTNRPEHKRSFIPSRIEKEKVSRLVHAIKMGWIKPRAKKDRSQNFYMLWDNKNEEALNRRLLRHIPAPKMKLPGHEESYNPPPEYLPTKEEEEEWNEQDPEDRPTNFLPKKYPCLRLVPAYADFIKERFERCLDLYLCPRQRKMRLNVDPNDLIPQLPKPRDLQPFPTTLSIIYKGHTDLVRCISVEPSGQFLASGSDDHTARVWEVLTGRCLKTFRLGGAIKSLAWCPNPLVSLIAVACGPKVVMLNPNVGDRLTLGNTDRVLRGLPSDSEVVADEKTEGIDWSQADETKWPDGFRVVITHPSDVKQVTWHGRGDYFAAVAPEAGTKSVVVHLLSQRRSQYPFQRIKGKVQQVLFHPSRPYIFVSTQRYIRIYNLQKQELHKKLLANCQWVSSMAIHPQGDNLIVGSYDSKLSWFDLDLSAKPYKTLRHHKKAIRQVAYHRRYPLFASGSDDASVIVCHGTVYNDLLQNPLIVPVKVLKGHGTVDGLGVLDCCFHPQQPWLFSAGADATVRLYT